MPFLLLKVGAPSGDQGGQHFLREKQH
jgi:hypothetical protein